MLHPFGLGLSSTKLEILTPEEVRRASPTFSYAVESPIPTPWGMIFSWLTDSLLIIHLGYLLYEFNGFWMNEKPENIMKFNEVKDKFEQRIRKVLQSPDVNLELTFKAEDDTVSVSSIESLERETVL